MGIAPRKRTWPDGTIFETGDHDGIVVLTGDTKGARRFTLMPRLVAVVALYI